jgi:hypothetical protein
MWDSPCLSEGIPTKPRAQDVMIVAEEGAPYRIRTRDFSSRPCVLATRKINLLDTTRSQRSLGASTSFRRLGITSSIFLTSMHPKLHDTMHDGRYNMQGVIPAAAQSVILVAPRKRDPHYAGNHQQPRGTHRWLPSSTCSELTRLVLLRRDH